MRWPLFVILAIIALCFDASLGSVLTFRNVTPSLTVILVTYVAIYAPATIVPWAGWAIGLMVDLMIDLPHGGLRAGPMIGPHALGYAFGAYLVVHLRRVLFQGQIHTIAVTVFFFSIASSLVAVFIYSVHSYYEPVTIHWADTGPARELMRRILTGGLTAIVALFIGPILVLTTPLWGFRQPMARTPRRL